MAQREPFGPDLHGLLALARVDGQFVVNPTHSQLETADLNLLLGGHNTAINMIEVEAKQVSEEVVAEAVQVAHKTVIEVCQMIDELVAMCGKKKEFTVNELDEELYKEVKAQIGSRLYELKQIREKSERNDAVAELFDNVATQYCTPADANSEARCEGADA